MSNKFHHHHFDGEHDDSNDSSFRETSFTTSEKEFERVPNGRGRPRIIHHTPKILSNTPTTTTSGENIYLQQCLDYIHRVLSRKDKDDFFQYPVTDLIAPGYSSIIKRPMDFSTMKKKLDTFQYSNILEYRDDLVLMCENAMTYNKSDTIYFHAARKLLDSGLKLLNKDKLLSLRRTLPVMKNLTLHDLGFEPDGEAEQSYDYQIMLQRKKQAQKQQAATQATVHHNHQQQYQHQAAVAKSQIFQKLEIFKNETKETPESVLADTQAAAKTAADKLAAKFPNSRLGYLRRNSNGAATFNFLNKDENAGEKDLTVGNLCEVLDSGSYSLTSFMEEKKNKAKPLYYMEYGPFSSHAPIYDSSYSNLTKDENDLLMSTYGDETAYQYALSLMEFAKGTGPTFVKYVDDFLNTITNSDHQKYLDASKTKATTTTASEASSSSSSNENAVKDSGVDSSSKALMECVDSTNTTTITTTAISNQI